LQLLQGDINSQLVPGDVCEIPRSLAPSAGDANGLAASLPGMGRIGWVSDNRALSRP